jgi:hypothetical protein
MSTEFDAKLGQQAKDTSRIVDDLTGKIVQNREQITEQFAKLSEEMNTVKINFAKGVEIFQKKARGASGTCSAGGRKRKICE